MIKDTHKLQGFGMPKMPKLHGHIMIKTYYAKSGNLAQVEEGENIVTDAISDMMSANYLGGIDYSKIFGANGVWKKWFGGVLAYQNAHANLDTDKYFCPSESNNHLVAHAGQSAIDVDHDDDMRRGSPTPSAFVETENSMKQVWEWGTTHGNGNISAISLCHADVGDVGLGSAHYAFQNFSPFEIINGSQLSAISGSCFSPDNLLAQYDDNHGISFTIGDGTDSGSEGWYAGHLAFETDKITVYIRRLPYAKAGLFETAFARSNQPTKFTITLPFNLYCQPCFYFDYTTKYLYLFTNVTALSENLMAVIWDSENINYCVIDCVNKALVDLGSGIYYKTIQSDTADIAPLCYTRYVVNNNHRYANIIKDGDYFYFPTTSGVVWGANFNIGEDMNINGFKRIKNTSADQSFISLTSEMEYCKPMIKHGDLLVASGMVINDSGYPCASQLEDIYAIWGLQEPNKPSMLVIPSLATSQATSKARYILANKLLHTTKFNLQNMVTKDATKSMLIEYTLTEASGNGN
jgi:hypothetical protein